MTAHAVRTHSRTPLQYVLVARLALLVAMVTVLALSPRLITRQPPAYRLSCLQNLWDLKRALEMYSMDWDGVLPLSAPERFAHGWEVRILPYVSVGDQQRPFFCPLDSDRSRMSSYSLNTTLGPRPFPAKMPSSRILLREDYARHDGNAGHCYVDGHVRWLPLAVVSAEGG